MKYKNITAMERISQKHVTGLFIFNRWQSFILFHTGLFLPSMWCEYFYWQSLFTRRQFNWNSCITTRGNGCSHLTTLFLPTKYKIFLNFTVVNFLLTFLSNKKTFLKHCFVSIYSLHVIIQLVVLFSMPLSVMIVLLKLN